MSTRALTIILVVLLLVAVGLFGAFFLFSGHGGSTTATSTPRNPFGGVGGGAGAGGDTNSLSLVAKDGSTVTVPDFRADHPAVQEGSQRYYYLTQNQETQGDAAQFDIVYGSDSSVLITLLALPLSSARAAGEASLRTFLPLSDAQLCALNVTVAVPNGVDDTYSGQNLGLDFCPNAVALP